ncbi:MAG: orotidine-5'-phosphate decarboxylase [Fimbriimonadaceae bacterium]
MHVRKVICALDTGDFDEAARVVRRLSPYVGAFKVGHALTLPFGLSVVDRLREAGANRVFLDLKFHDIPNSVALAVREASKYGVWMMTLHIAGGPAMITAAVEEARTYGEDLAPKLVGVSVLTSLDQHTLTDYLGVPRTIEDHMVALSKMGTECGLDGVVCSTHEVRRIRQEIGREGIIVVPGIRLVSGPTHDQIRVGTAQTALEAGADYLVIGRALTDSTDIEATLEAFGFAGAA